MVNPSLLTGRSGLPSQQFKKPKRTCHRLEPQFRHLCQQCNLLTAHECSIQFQRPHFPSTDGENRRRIYTIRRNRFPQLLPIPAPFSVLFEGDQEN